MTRRIMKRQPLSIRYLDPELYADANDHYAFFEDERGKCVLYDEQQYVILPKYNIGDVVAVAQSYAELHKVLAARDFKRTDVLYDEFYHAMQFAKVCDTDAGWNNKMFVKADLMPHRIKITDVKAERLQDISDEDCLREGVYHYTSYRIDCFSWGNSWHCFETPREAFAELIDKICGEGTWVRNPICFAYGFRLIR